ncbi:GH18289 [Drosophila grimshawi]|uniref:GH18289 n=1 Tax=Drosophila grimshawi TaxID=7222 RepID=B4JSD6_DROGR|nr:GH18289 [Drosophila grimshawi]
MPCTHHTQIRKRPIRIQKRESLLNSKESNVTTLSKNQVDKYELRDFGQCKQEQRNRKKKSLQQGGNYTHKHKMAASRNKCE